jgi:hypothetical protein
VIDDSSHHATHRSDTHRFEVVVLHGGRLNTNSDGRR